MGDGSRARLQLPNQKLPKLPADPRGTHYRVGLIFQSRREVYDGAARIACRFPVGAGRILVCGKESKIYILKLFGAHVLDECDLVSHCFQLSQRFIVIQQLDIDRRKIAIVEHVGNFLALERACADDGEAVEITSANSVRLRRRNGLEIRTHEVCEASWYGGGGGLRVRRTI